MAREMGTNPDGINSTDDSGIAGAQEYGSAPAGYAAGESATEGSGSTGGMGAQVREKAGEYAGAAQEKAAEYGRAAQEQAEVGKERAAEGMQRMAEQLRERTPDEGVTAAAGQKVAEGMERTAGYLREHEMTEMWSDLEEYVRQHPMQAMAGAVFAGFVIGRMIR
jgi:ElaB/YqjD/DUF883 family membrane-anchored ribosome-binding protein